jgi:hypothetical protein
MSSGMWHHVARVRTDVSEEWISSIIRLEIIWELAFILASWLFPAWWWSRYVPPKRRFLQEPHGVTSQETTLFMVTSVKTSNLIWKLYCLLKHWTPFNILSYWFLIWEVLQWLLALTFSGQEHVYRAQNYYRYFNWSFIFWNVGCTYKFGSQNISF